MAIISPRWEWRTRILTGAAKVINILFKRKIWLTNYDT